MLPGTGAPLILPLLVTVLVSGGREGFVPVRVGGEADVMAEVEEGGRGGSFESSAAAISEPIRSLSEELNDGVNKISDILSHDHQREQRSKGKRRAAGEKGRAGGRIRQAEEG